MVSHDRYLLNRVPTHIAELRPEGFTLYKGNYEAWLVQKQAMLEREAKQAESRRKLIENELRWVHTTPSGRRAKGRDRVRR